MLSSNVSASFEGNDDIEMISYELQNMMLENIYHAELRSKPLDSRVVANKCDKACALHPLNFQHQNSFLNVPIFKDVSMPITKIKRFSSPTSNPEDLSNTKSLALPVSQSMEIVAADSTIQNSKTKVALKFCSKKCNKFSLNFRSSSIVPVNYRFQSLMKSLKNTMKVLAKAIPLTNVMSQIHDSIINKINGKKLQDWVEFLGSFFKHFKKYKRVKGSEKGPDKAPTKKLELEHLAAFQFVKPKFYECCYCNTRFYKLPIYIRNIRRHAKIIRCDKCCEAFSSVISKRRHQLHCRQRIIV